VGQPKLRKKKRQRTEKKAGRQVSDTPSSCPVHADYALERQEKRKRSGGKGGRDGRENKMQDSGLVGGQGPNKMNRREVRHG
jgi:hypothetical protein